MVTAGRRYTVFHRLLRPLTEAADLGLQRLDVNIAGVTGELVLMTRPGPDYEVSWDWSYWSELVFVR